ncbi:hypothetical protein [Pseudomonas sp. SCB32]|uniref:hypothetical protein n=1 Tax=Pseudomonas sp. SCB32 TaxID=2653853 RepID=UPI001263F23B|nr:hypothetical protein [Pseudomonas sp. SCB32]
MENVKRKLTEIRDGMQDIQCQVIFMGSAMTSNTALCEQARAGAWSIFSGISSKLSDLDDAANQAYTAIDQGSAPS